MGCGCGKSSVLGVNPSNPLIFGEDDASMPVIRATLLEAANGTPVGATRYVRGSLVDSMIEDGKLRRL